MDSDDDLPAAMRAYRALEQAIVTLDLLPGITTTEGALMERLPGLGRTPIREAIQRLSWEGLILIRPRAGLMIAPLNASDWIKVLDARRGLEVILAESAARLASQSNTLSAYRSCAEAMVAAASDDDPHGFLQADKELDELLAADCDNHFAARMSMPLQTHSRRFWYRYRSGTDLEQSAEGHTRLVAAILKQDKAAAAQAAGGLIDILRRVAERVA